MHLDTGISTRHCVCTWCTCRWLAAYSAAASFRFSHYFVSVLSQFGALSSGIGRTGTDNWYDCRDNIMRADLCLISSSFRSEFHVVRPLRIELPRSLGTVVTNWNLPMHVFLKNCKCCCRLQYISTGCAHNTLIVLKNGELLC